jgi:hypothetical protein
MPGLPSSRRSLMGARTIFCLRPLLERLIAHESERLAGVVSAVHLQRVFQHRRGHENARRSLVT